MPPSMALRITRLSNDPEAEGKLWEEYMERVEKENEEKAQRQLVAQQALKATQENNTTDTNKGDLDDEE